MDQISYLNFCVLRSQLSRHLILSMKSMEYSLGRGLHMTTPRAPGWYEDPADPGAERLWNSQGPTSSRRRKVAPAALPQQVLQPYAFPAPAYPQPPSAGLYPNAPCQGKSWKPVWVFLAVAAFAVALMVIAFVLAISVVWTLAVLLLLVGIVGAVISAIVIGAGHRVPVQPAASQHGGPVATNPSNVLSIMGIVCGGIAFLFLPPLFGIAGLILGGIGMSNKERLAPWALGVSGAGLIAGLIIGYLLWRGMYGF